MFVKYDDNYSFFQSGLKDLKFEFVSSVGELNKLIEEYPDSYVQEAFIDGSALVHVKVKTKIENPITSIEPGYYRYDQSFFNGHYWAESLVKDETRKDRVLNIYDDSLTIESDIANFMNKLHIYEALECTPKKGFLLYGPPGNGKTSILRRIAKSQEGAIIVTLSEIPNVEFLHALSNLKQTKVFVIEELTEMCRGYVGEVLNFLDGETSVSNGIVLASTNYPEKLPGNIVDRPGRFDKLFRFGNPDPTNVAKLLKHFLNEEPSVARIKLCKGKNIAQIKEICINSILSETTFEEEVIKDTERAKLVKADFQERCDMVGF